MTECAFWFKSQGTEKMNLNELFFQGTDDCQNLRYEKSDYFLSQIHRNFQSCCIEYKIVTERNHFFLMLNECI